LSFLPAGSLVVSCQADVNSPLHGPTFMAAMAQAAELGGAAGFRVEGAADIAAVRQVTTLPVIGIKKGERSESTVFITARFSDAAAVVRAGADIVAVDATSRPRPGGEPLEDLVARIHDELGVPVLGDVDSLPSGRFAHSAGVDALATTLAGYTGSPAGAEPDFALLKELVALDVCPVVAEGRVSRPEHVERAFRCGAHAVVIGKAITDPAGITKTFAAAVPRGAGRWPDQPRGGGRRLGLS
jgi:N-acylglucosamine-6-phosphate 2-epimerase